MAVIISAAGIKKGITLSEYVSYLQNISLFVREYRRCIVYCEYTVQKIISDYSSRKECPEFIINCSKLLKEEDFPTAWSKSVDEDKKLNKSDKTLMIDLGACLGSGDKNTQINSLDYIIDCIELSLSKSREIEKSDKKLYTVIGFSIGLLVLIMTI